MKNNMNLCFSLILILSALFALSGCGQQTGPMEGVEIHVANTDGTAARDLYADPVNIKIAFTKLWFPTDTAFAQLKSSNTNYESGVIYINNTTDFTGLDFYKALTSDAASPYVFDSSTGTPFEPTEFPGYNRTFHGVMMETAYFEMEMSDYSIRWYTQDSGSYKARDVLINDGSGWKFAFIRRVIEFDFTNSSANTNKVENAFITGVTLITRDSRDVSGEYFENWYMNGSQTIDNGYVWSALGVYKDNSGNTLQQNYIGIGTDLTNETLTQYFRITRDVPNDSNPTNAYIGQDLADGYWSDTGALPPCPELLAGTTDGSYDNPKVIYTFPESENEAKRYKIAVYYHFERNSEGVGGLGIASNNNTLSAASTWAQLVSYVSTNDDFISLCPVTGGKETRFGWLDFDDTWQGEFSVDADS